MTKLEWCRANAPEAMRNMDDASILEFMEESWNDYGREKPVVENDYEVVRNALDKMVLDLVREYGNKIVFKGGYMLSKLIPEHARQTYDVDFSIQNSELYKELMSSMNAIGKKFIADGIISKYEVEPEVRKGHSGGMKMYLQSGKKIGIDVGWHDVTFGTTTATIDIAEVESFSPERMICDKVRAILSRKRFRRSKYIYDLYCITNSFDFDRDVVISYMEKSEETEPTEWSNYPFNEVVMREYAKAYNSLSLNSVVTGKPLPKPDFDLVMSRFDALYRAFTDKSSIPSKWSHVTRCFE